MASGAPRPTRAPRLLMAAIVLVLGLAASACGGSLLGAAMAPLDAAQYACDNDDREVLVRSIKQADESADGRDPTIPYLLRDLAVSGSDFASECEVFFQLSALVNTIRGACRVGDPAQITDLIDSGGTEAIEADELIDLDQFEETCERRFGITVPDPELATTEPAPAGTVDDTPGPVPAGRAAVLNGAELSDVIFAVYEQSNDPLAQIRAVVPVPPLQAEFQDADVRLFSTSADASGNVHTRVRFRTSRRATEAREELESLMAQVTGPVIANGRKPTDDAQRTTFRIDPATFADGSQGAIAYVLDQRDDGAEILIHIETTSRATFDFIATWPGKNAPFPRYDSISAASFRSEATGRSLSVEYGLSTLGNDLDLTEVRDVLRADFRSSPFQIISHTEGGLFDFVFNGRYHGWIIIGERNGQIETRYVANDAIVRSGS